MLEPPKDRLDAVIGLLNGLIVSLLLWAIILYLCV